MRNLIPLLLLLLVCIANKGFANQAVETNPQKEKADVEVLPNEDHIMQPFIADPRNLSFSMGFRYFDDPLDKNMANISLGEEFLMLQLHDVELFKKKGELQIGFAAGIWSVFTLDAEADDIVELINTDYFVGIPVTFGFDKWAFRWRLYHVSAHLGDEYMIANPNVERKNPSIEATDLFASYIVSKDFRLYGGLGYIIRNDPGYPLHPLYLEYGMEVKFPKFLSDSQQVSTRPFFAMHMRNLEDLGWNLDTTTRIGLEWQKYGNEKGRKARLYLEYHNGYSLEGQFSKEETSYVAINVSVGY